MNVAIKPEPSAEERRAILQALAASSAPPPAYQSLWRASALDDLRDGAFAEESGSDAGVIQS